MRNLVIFLSGLLVGCAADGRRPLAAATTRAEHAIDLGRVPADALFDVVVGVRLRNERRLNITVAALAVRQDALSPDDFADRFGASPRDYARVVGALGACGFTVVRVTAGRTLVTVRGNAAAIRCAFGADMHAYRDAAGEFTSASAVLAVADEALADLSGVAGLDGAYRWATHLAPPLAGGMPDTPSDLENRYHETLGAGGVPSNPGSGQTVAILSTNTATNVADLNQYLATFQPGGVTALAAGQYTQVLVGGPLRDPADPLAYDENVLDPEMVLATAPFAKIVQVFTATNDAGLFTDGIGYIVNELPDAHTVTVSWGTCERGAGGEMPILNALFAQARAEGQQWFFASGDTGADGCRDGRGNKIFSAGWPASSPNAIGVGGTQLAANDVEVAWTGGGGGPSETLDKPAYQTGVGPGANDQSRDEPDLAALAGTPGVAYVSGGQQSGIGGTSAAAPVCAGLYAVLMQQKAAAKGTTNALEQLYALGRAGSGFNDITAGVQNGPGRQPGGGYAAGTGYDLATGWGSPNLVQWLAGWK